MNITFWLMETLLKINASIFGENGASSRLTQLTVKGLHFVQQISPAEIGAAFGDFVQGLRGRRFHQPIVRRSVTWKN
jgi:hypothetical protein